MQKNLLTILRTVSALHAERPGMKKTLHADLLLAGITQLTTAILADEIHHHGYIRSIKPLIA